MIDDRSEAIELGAKIALFVGMLAFGVMLGAAVGLAELQQSCIATGKLPAPGVPVLPGTLEELACFESARRLKLLANGAGILGAVLLLGGGLLDRYGGRIAEVRG